jgi:hypothetical protein
MEIRFCGVIALSNDVSDQQTQMGGKGLRCIGLERATLQLNFKAATYNLRRLCSLKTCGITPAFAFYQAKCA